MPKELRKVTAVLSSSSLESTPEKKCKVVDDSKLAIKESKDRLVWGKLTYFANSLYCFEPQHRFSNYWMRLSRIWRFLQIKKDVIHRDRRPRWITTSEICRILHILWKPNSIIALLFIQNISPFLKEFRHFSLCFSAHQNKHNLVPRFSRWTVQ